MKRILQHQRNHTSFIQRLYATNASNGNKIKEPRLSKWKTEESRKQFFETAAKTLNCSIADLPTRLTYKKIRELGGRGILDHYSSIPTAIMELFGLSHTNQQANLALNKYLLKKKKFYWDNVAHRKRFLEDFAAKNNFQSWEDWYSVKAALVKKSGGSFINVYYGSLRNALQLLFPEFPWQSHKFLQLSKLDVKNQDKLLEAMKAAELALGITEPQQWYLVNNGQLKHCHVKLRALERCGGKAHILKLMYPDFNWNSGKFIQGARYAQQRQLFRVVKIIFPSEEVEEEWPQKQYHGLSLKFKESTRAMHFDIAIPRLKLVSTYSCCVFCCCIFFF